MNFSAFEMGSAILIYITSEMTKKLPLAKVFKMLLLSFGF